MAVIAVMVALIGGSVFIRVLLKHVGVSVARKTNSGGCGCLVALLLLIGLAIAAVSF